MDCTAEGKEICNKQGVSGYPTLKAFKRGEKTFDYEGPRDAGKISFKFKYCFDVLIYVK